MFLFKSGQTTNEDWSNQVKTRLAPWAEIEIPGQYILSVPASTVNTNNDIVAVGRVYEKLMFWVNKLAGLEKRFRAERFVFDIQISAGNCLRFAYHH